MQKTKVFLLVPTYSGVTGTIQAAFDLASSVDPDGPIQFRLVDYPEENPKYYMMHDDGFAPCFDGDLCTLATCKKNIRLHANPGDVVG